MPLCLNFFAVFVHALCTQQVSQKEYIDDFQEPMLNVPKHKMAMVALWLIPFFGWIGFVAYIISTNKKAQKHVDKVFGKFNEKYERSRGVSLSRTQVMQTTRKGSAIVDAIKVTVKQPGVPIPGVPLFPLSKEGLIAVQAYQNGVQTGTPMAGPSPYGTAPMAPATPAGYPQATPYGNGAMPPGYEVDPSSPYPM